MTLVVPNEAEVLALAAWAGKTASATPWTLKLFSNNVTPGSGDTAATYTEVAGGGYANFNLTAASWTITANAPSSMTHPAHTFSFTGATNAPGTIYGYYIVDANNKIVVAERLASPPFTPSVNGDSVTVTPTITLGSVSA